MPFVAISATIKCFSHAISEVDTVRSVGCRYLDQLHLRGDFAGLVAG